MPGFVLLADCFIDGPENDVGVPAKSVSSQTVNAPRLLKDMCRNRFFL